MTKFKITSAHSGLQLNTQGNGKVNGTNLMQYGGSHGPGNEWLIEVISGGKVLISSAHCGLRLNAASNASGEVVSGANAQLWEGEGPGNEWIIEHIPGGKVYITNPNFKLRLNTAGNKKESGSNVQVYLATPGPGNEWIIEAC